MNHHHVKYFLDAVRLGSVAKAAELNFVTHPAVSQAIRTLENEMQAEFISHRKRRFELTEAGLRFVEHGKKWLEQYEVMRGELLSSKGDLRGDIFMAGAQSITADFVGPALFQMKKAHPNVHFRYSFGEAAFIREKVKNNEIQVGFLIDDDQTAEFDSLTIGAGKFILISNTPKARFDKFHFIVTNKQKVEVKALMHEFQKKNLPWPEVFMELVSWSLIRKFALKEDIIGLVPEYLVQDDLKTKKLFELNLGIKKPNYTVKVIWKKGSYQSAALKEFLNLVKTNNYSRT